MTNSPDRCSAANEHDWLLLKRGLFYRPNNSGYTGIRDEAGRYSREDADKHMAAGGKAVRVADAPEFMPGAYSDIVIKRLTEQRDEARQLVIEANNSLYGSQAYFHSLNGGAFDKYHLSRGIEALKTANRQSSVLDDDAADGVQVWMVIDQEMHRRACPICNGRGHLEWECYVPLNQKEEPF